MHQGLTFVNTQNKTTLTIKMMAALPVKLHVNCILKCKAEGRVIARVMSTYTGHVTEIVLSEDKRSPVWLVSMECFSAPIQLIYNHIIAQQFGPIVLYNNLKENVLPGR